MNKRINYLNNKDILAEIAKSKNTFCSYTDPDYAKYDIILPSKDKVNIRTIAEAKRNKAKRLQQEAFEEAKAQNKRVKLAEFAIDYRKIDKYDLVFRIMTFDHVPDEPGRKKNPKTVADTKVKLNFPPFQHFKFNDKDELVCIGKSHWEGGMENGYFNLRHGQATNKLALMWMKLCDRYATRGNVRGYTYNDEMRGQAILQLSQIGLQLRVSIPTILRHIRNVNSFVRVINIEKRNQNIRDDILEMNNMNPSYTRQAAGEWERSKERHGEVTTPDSSSKKS